MRDTSSQFYKKLLGGKGELIVETYLKKNGYKILEKNYRTNFGEADIIAEIGDLLVFVEVKTRSGYKYGAPAEAVGFYKQNRYVKLAEYYALKNPKYRDKCVRFDVAEVLDDEVNYIENAFYCR